jgi:two-component system chemotaxis response regulator CheB
MSIALVPPAADARPDCIRVMVVDDAVVVRGLLARWIGSETGLEVVASLRNGREAIERLKRVDPDVVILDVDMPDIDGITALPRLMAMKRGLVVIMTSTLTRRNAEISLRALALGAADYIPKPQTTHEITVSPAFRRDLIEKIRALGRRKRVPPAARVPVSAVHAHDTALQQVASPQLAAQADGSGIQLRPFPSKAPRVLLVGASTGGPQALNAFVGNLNGVIDHAPVLIVQHMPPGFTTILAEHLSRASGRPAREAVDGEPVRAGQIYVAPGGRHMRVARSGGYAVIALDDGPLVNFCRPAVDPLFSSAAEVWGARNLAVVLTGMGSDGVRGAGDVVRGGGCVIAQDEASSVVWGMPGAVVQAGLCSAVLPLDQMAPKIMRLFSWGHP